MREQSGTCWISGRLGLGLFDRSLLVAMGESDDAWWLELGGSIAYVYRYGSG